MFPSGGGGGGGQQQSGQQPTVWENLLNFLFSRKMLNQQAAPQPYQQQIPQQTPQGGAAYSQDQMSAMAQQAADAARRQEQMKHALINKLVQPGVQK